MLTSILKNIFSISSICSLLLLIACETKNKHDSTDFSASKETLNVQDNSHEVDENESSQKEGINILQDSWDLVNTSFQQIDSFPIGISVFPLQAIISDGDTLKVNGNICYSFPKEVTNEFVGNYVEETDSLSIWHKEYGQKLGNGIDFQYGFYPYGKFTHNNITYYIYYTLDYLTGRGSFDLSFYLATATNHKWNSTYIGERSYSKYNTYEFIEGEEFIKERMASELNFTIQLEKNKLINTHFEGAHVVGEAYNIFEVGQLIKTSEVTLDSQKNNFNAGRIEQIELSDLSGQHPNKKTMQWFLNNYKEEFIASDINWKTLKHEDLMLKRYSFHTPSNISVTLIFCKNQNDALLIAEANFPLKNKKKQITGVNGGVLFVVQGDDPYAVNDVLGWFAGEE